MTQEINLTASDRAVAHAAAKDNGRLALATLHFGDGEIAAADGFVLAVKKVKGLDESVNIMLPADAILKAKDIGKHIPNIVVTLPESDGKAADILMQDFAKVSVSPVEGTFLNYKLLFPTKPVAATISLDPKKLKQLLAIAGKDTHKIKLEVYDSESPVKFTCHNDLDAHDTVGLIMPMVSDH